MEAVQVETIERQDHQQSNKGTTFLRTCFNGLNTLAGIGLLSTPYALSEGGWLSLLFLFALAVLFFYTGLLIHRCMEANPLIRTYPDIGGLAFGWKGRTLISIFMYLELYFAAVEFLILGGDSFEKLFPNTTLFAGVKLSVKQGFTVLSALVVLPTTWLKSLGLLSYVSACGVFASIAVICCVFWVGAVDGVGFHERGVLFHRSGLVTAVSMYAFCYCGHPVFPTLRNSMKDRSQFPKVLINCFFLSCLGYGSMAVLGYLMYGQNIKSQVTLNLPLRNISSQIAIYTTVINPLTKYAVIITPVAAAIEEKLSCFITSRLISLVIRTALVLSTLVVALTIPFFDSVMAFIGSFFGVVVAILFPCLCYLKLNGPWRRLGLELIILALVLLVGSLIGTVGTYNSVRRIIRDLRGE
ncbi:hypothetical protein Nepgr_024565 [Nepenthes gracilis]|uniref:Amino acid transporter transmembrane domain-containing protein n=1 Tax=Nepenthes gracilis TaxID=150966 RepID=A0AAD3XYQ7_NEPGR|nr:hypothetical protein Nepgr_024565 [Nepenthes gracilis]